MQMRRNLPPAKRNHGLDQAGHAGRGLEVPDICLDRAHQQRLLGAATLGDCQYAPLHRIGPQADVIMAAGAAGLIDRG